MSAIPKNVEALGEPYIRLWREFSEFPNRKEVSARIRIFKPRSLANLDCQGRGPADRLVFAGKVCYPRDQVVVWFASLARSPKSVNPNPAEAKIRSAFIVSTEKEKK